MAESSRPWGNSGQPSPPEMYQDRWRRLLRAFSFDGICNATDGTALAVATTGGTQIQVLPGEYVIEGAHYILDAPKTLDVGAIGVQPTVTQTRRDLVVIRYNPSAQTVTAELLPGTPATSGAVEPGLTRLDGGIWEAQLWAINRTGPVAITAAMLDDRRRYSSPLVMAPQGWTPNTVPLGAVAIHEHDVRVRELVDGVPAWRSLTDPPWSSVPAVSGVTSSLAYRRRLGMVDLAGAFTKTTGGWNTGTITLGTLPAEARPASNFRAPVALAGSPSDGGPGVAAAEIRSTGTVLLFNTITGTGSAFFNLSFRPEG